MKPFIFLIFLFFLIPLVYSAGEKVIFDTDLKTGDHTAVDGTNFSVVINEHTNKTFVSVDGYNFIIKTGKCAMEGDIVACVADMWETEDFNQDMFKWEHAIRFNMSRKIPDVTLTADYTKTQLLIGERSNVNIIWGNQGDKPATGMRLSYKYPGFIKIISVEGCEEKNGVVSWAGTLEPLAENICQLKIAATSVGEANAVAELTYNDGFSTRKSEVKKTLKGKGYVVDVKAELFGENFSVGDTTTLNLSFKPLTMIKSFYYGVTFPDGVEILDEPNFFRIIEGKYVYDTTIDENEFYLFDLRFDYQGNFSIISEVKYQVDDLFHEFIEQTNFSAKGDNLALMKLTDKFEFYIINPTPKDYVDLELSYIIDGRPYSISYDRINRTRNIQVEFNYVGEKTDVPVEISMVYKTLEGQILEANASMEFHIDEEIDEEIQEPLENNEEIVEESKPESKGTILGVAIAFILIIIVIIVIIFRVMAKKGKELKEVSVFEDNEI